MLGATWQCFDGLVCRCVSSEHVAQVLSCCGELGGFGWRKGAIDPPTEAHHAGLIEGCPQLHFGAKLPAHTTHLDPSTHILIIIITIKTPSSIG